MTRRLLFTLLCILSATSLLAVPTVTTQAPVASATVSSLSTISVTFSEAVTGVDADDLLINADAAQFVTGSGAGPYVFTFTQPAAGLVNVGWAGDHGIVGQAGTGAFAPSMWVYTLNDTIAPTVILLSPSASAVLASLTQVEVTFSENVTGVNAADLLVNGVAATGMTGSGAGPFVFTFTQPAAGTVTLAWAAGHGIKDLATVPNNFAGGSWSVTLNAAGHGTLRLNEFLASNGTGMADENAVQEDWIEIYNSGTTTVNLGGWALTNDHGDLGKWVFPAWTLNVGEYMVVWASGNHRKPAQTTAGVDNANTLASARLHTNFTINENGGYLALIAPESPRTVVTQYPPNYDELAGVTEFPSQRTDYSYGPQTGDNALRYFVAPTPKASNGTSLLTASTLKPNFSVTRGFFKDSFQLVLTCADATATIRYTTDFTEPTSGTGTLYSGPITVSATTCLRAVAFGTSKIPSLPVTHTYIFLDQLLSQNNTPSGFPTTWGTYATFAGNIIPADYEMDTDPLRVDPLTPTSAVDPVKLQRFNDGMRELPMVSIVIPMADMFLSTGLYYGSTVSAQNNIENKNFPLKKCSVEMILPDGSSAFSETCGLSGHGNASRTPSKNPKHGFQIKFKGDYGSGSLNYPIFTDSPVKQYDDLILRPDFGTSWRHWSDNTTNSLGNNQRSRGTRTRDAYIKNTFSDMGWLASHHRFFHLYINGIYWGTYDFAEQPVDGFVSAYFGGDKADYSIYHEGVAKNGTDAAYTNMTGLAAITTNALYDQMKSYLDVPQFTDYLLLQFFVGAQDWGLNKNWYAFRRRATTANPSDGKYQYIPWDEENTLLDTTIDRVGTTDLPSGLHAKMLGFAQYKLDFADRVQKHMIAPGGALTLAANVARWQKWQAILDKPIVAESCRWGDYRRDVHPYADGTYALYTRENQWLTENTRIVGTYLPGRTATVMAQLQTAGLYPAVAAPEYRQTTIAGTVLGTSTVAAGNVVAMNNPGGAGIIYYTLDGNDPHILYTPTTATTFAASGTGTAYTVPLTINTTTTIKSRILRGGVWSALNEATFTVGISAASVRITEIFYQPTTAQGGSAAEFIELQNIGTKPVNMSEWSFGGVDYIFPIGTILNPGNRLVVASDNTPLTFAAQFPSVSVFGFFNGSLNNAGDRIALNDATGRTITAVEYGITAPWPTTPHGGGYSLEVIDASGDPNSPLNWKASAALKGTPGAANSIGTASSVLITEFLAVNAGAYTVSGATPDFVEIQNTSASMVDIGGWQIRSATLGSYTFPLGTMILPNERLLVHFTTAAIAGYRFSAALPDNGDTLSLLDATGAALDGVRYGPQAANYSFSHIGNTWALSTPTAGAANSTVATAAQSNLRLNEWLANPTPGFDDWLELTNTSATQPVVLAGLLVSTSTELFRIAVPAAIAPSGYAQLICNHGGTRGDTLDFNLPAAGTTLALIDSTGVAGDTITFTAQTENVSQGRFPNATGSAVAQPYPNPGVANYSAITGSVQLNEILLTNINGDNAPWARRPSWLELRNPSGSSVDLSGWRLRDPRNPGTSWAIPSGTSIAAGAHLAIWCDPTQAGSTVAALNLNNPIPLVDGVELVNAASQTVDRIAWGAQLPDLSIGRVSGGAWALLISPTRGTTNTPAATLGVATALRINEWCATGTGLGGFNDYVELYNTSALPIALGGLYLSDDPSEVGRRKYRITDLSFIAASGFTTFTADGTAPTARTTGYTLTDTGEYLRLSLADDTQLAVVSFGLQTIGMAQGSQPEGSATVATFTPSPGVANVNGTGPSFTSVPASRSLPAGAATDLTVTAANATSYQWRLNGTPIGGATSATYSIPSVASANDGIYTCVATGPGGSNTSLPATLTVLHTYATWAASYGLSGAAANETADPDGDGFTNLAEFLANSNPTVTATPTERTASQALGTIETSAGVPTYLTLDLRVNRRAAYNTFTGEVTTSLTNAWTPATPDLTQLLSTESNGDQHWRFKYALPGGTAQKYVRLRITE